MNLAQRTALIGVATVSVTCIASVIVTTPPIIIAGIIWCLI